MTDASPDISPPKPDRERLLQILDEMILTVDNLPQHAKLQPITHYDYETLLVFLRAILKTDPEPTVPD